MTILPVEPPAVAVAPAGRFSIQLYSPTPNGPVNWRLLSANNRECGRGSSGFAREGDCREAVAGLRTAISTGSVRVRRETANRWCWVVDVDDRPVAMSGHSFDRMIRCRQAASLFTASFAGAVLQTNVLDLSARRRPPRQHV